MGDAVLGRVLPNLSNIAHEQHRYAWASFRDGVEICRLYDGGPMGPTAALLRYAPGAEVPEHEHAGAEWIMVLTGSQADERGEYAAGTLVINPPGSRHRVWTGGGCIVLAIWQRPVVFV